jgi:hypothetical protein
MSVSVSATTTQIRNYLLSVMGPATLVNAKTHEIRDTVRGVLVRGNIETYEAPEDAHKDTIEIADAIIAKAFKPWLDKPEKTAKKAS